MQTITIRKPDDWHCHLRDGAILRAVAPYTAARFGRAIVMPNLSPSPVTTTEALLAYKARIVEVAGPGFTPRMTYYLTDDSSPTEIVEGFKVGYAAAVKVYPAHATTNSAQGVTDIAGVYPVFEAMQEAHMPVLLHGETVRGTDGAEIAPADREKVFLNTTLPRLMKDFPELKIVLEHATTKDAADFVIEDDSSGRLAATVTAHHLILTKDEVTTAYEKCMPIIKTAHDRAALRKAVTSGDARFFLGTDSAPHTVAAKESANPPAGIFTAPAALSLYAQVFEEEGKLENLEAFASLNGPRFYGMGPNEETVTLTKEPWTIDSLVAVEDGNAIRPFGYHEEPGKRLLINWRVA